ncbi:hypothetical protein FACS1894139_11070 [Planctomycetales bacterium]|nr:hypothetical protein FACS1894139_11070 [Planctomycetales bacterium]
MRYALTLLCAAAVAVCSLAQAEEPEVTAMKTEVNDQLAEILDAPAGVFDAKFDGDGKLLRLKIKGEAEVPTSMSAAKADRYAREKAARDAKAAFTKWLGENVVFSETTEEGITVQEKNGAESSEALETSTKLYSSNSAAFLNGAKTLLDQVSGEGDRRTAIVVLGWSPKLAAAARTAKSEMGKPVTADDNAIPANGAKKSKGNTGNTTRAVKDLDDF